jgi:hypothetical protein
MDILTAFLRISRMDHGIYVFTLVKIAAQKMLRIDKLDYCTPLQFLAFWVLKITPCLTKVVKFLK